MIRRILSLMRDGLRGMLDHPQLILTLVLLIIIPLAFVFTSTQFLNVSILNQERLEKDRVGIILDLFASLAVESNFDIDSINNHISDISDLNPDITAFGAVVKDDGVYTTIASLNPDDIGRVESDESAIKPYQFAAGTVGESLIFPILKEDVRLWRAYRSVPDELNNPFIFLYLETSLEKIDDLFKAREQRAYINLGVVMLVVLILVFRQVKIIDYGYLYKELQQSNKTRDLFTNMITHELRTPLTAIRGYAEMVANDDKAQPEVKKYGNIIGQEAERLVGLVSDMLDVARIQSGKLKVETVTVNLNIEIESIVNILTPLAKKKDITIDIEMDDLITVNADPERLKQILTNTLSNSLKYTPEGSILIRVLKEKDTVQIRIEDTGIGISAEDQKNMFAPFFRVDSDETQKVTGTGLGMWITKQLIEAMGGSIGIESIKGTGTHTVIILKS